MDVGGGTTGVAVIQRRPGGAHRRRGHWRHAFFAGDRRGQEHDALSRPKQLKNDPRQQAALFPLVRPVMEKVGTIISRHIAGYPVSTHLFRRRHRGFPGHGRRVEEVTGHPTHSARRTALRDPARVSPCTTNPRALWQTTFHSAAYSYIDRMQPQYAAFVGTITQGDLPTEGMASLYIEMAPGNEAFRMVDIAVKATEARPGAQLVEREFGMFEVHSRSQSEVLEAGRVVLAAPGPASDRPRQARDRLGAGHHQRGPVPGAAAQPLPARQHAGAGRDHAGHGSARRQPTSTSPPMRPKRAPTSRCCMSHRSGALAACGCPAPRRRSSRPATRPWRPLSRSKAGPAKPKPAQGAPPCPRPFTPNATSPTWPTAA